MEVRTTVSTVIFGEEKLFAGGGPARITAKAVGRRGRAEWTDRAGIPSSKSRRAADPRTDRRNARPPRSAPFRAATCPVLSDDRPTLIGIAPLQILPPTKPVRPASAAANGGGRWCRSARCGRPSKKITVRQPSAFAERLSEIFWQPRPLWLAARSAREMMR